MATQKNSIDNTGRVVLPKAVREAAHLDPGTPLNITWEQDHIEIRPATLPMFVREDDGVYVAHAQGEVAPLSEATVAWALEQLRQERD